MARLSFTEHPASVGETYGEHLRSAWGFSVRMIGAGFACFVHGVLPFVFVTSGSSTVRRLYDGMIVHRVRASAQPSANPDSAP
jgi:Family of unknown function (DUF6356)